VSEAELGVTFREIWQRWAAEKKRYHNAETMMRFVREITKGNFVGFVTDYSLKFVKIKLKTFSYAFLFQNFKEMFLRISST
jgi:hypothetical protein